MPKPINKIAKDTSKPIRVQGDVHETFTERAAALAAERGVPEIKLPQYLAEASKFFEDNRPKK
jgi:hypothetical protein